MGVFVEKGNHFVEEGEIVAASCCQKGAMLGGGKIGGFVEECLNPIQSGAVHFGLPVPFI